MLSNSFIAELSATSAGRKPSLSTIEQSAPDCNSSFTIDRKSQVAAVIWNKRKTVLNFFTLNSFQKGLRSYVCMYYSYMQDTTHDNKECQS